MRYELFDTAGVEDAQSFRTVAAFGQQREYDTFVEPMFLINDASVDSDENFPWFVLLRGDAVVERAEVEIVGHAAHQVLNLDLYENYFILLL